MKNILQKKIEKNSRGNNNDIIYTAVGKANVGLSIKKRKKKKKTGG